MARTHEFPADRVHFMWDAGNEPVLTIASGDWVLASLAVDLRISEVVDAGQYIVSALLPLAVFRSAS